MKRNIIVILFLSLVINVNAADIDVPWYQCVRYWYSQNVSTNIPDFDDIVTMRSSQGIQSFDWKIENPPTKQHLQSLKDNAVIWSDQEDLGVKKNIYNWSEREKFLVMILWQQENRMRLLEGKQEVTKKQYVDAIKELWGEQ